MIIECPAGVRLQYYLLSQNIHLSTSCGGRGNCAKCVVKILKGNVTIQTMDKIWFTKEQLDQGYRLWCQVFTKEVTVVEIEEK